MKKTVVVLALLAIPIVLLQPVAKASATIPVQTDDGLDPVNMIFTGYAPASWVVQNLKGWNPTPCSEPKTLGGKTYDFTLETPDTRNQSPPCWGPRYHIRIWNMGSDPVLGNWSIGVVHHEHTECSIRGCVHVVDGWENAEALVRSTFTNGTATLSISNYTLNNAGLYQGSYNDGNATAIRLSPPDLYPATFVESGLGQGTFWSVTLNGTTSSSTGNSITFSKPKGTYSFTIGNVPGYSSDPSSGQVLLSSGRTVSLQFALTLEGVVNQPGVKLFLYVTSGAWALVTGSAVFVTIWRRKRG